MQLELFPKQPIIDRIKKYVQDSIDRDKCNNFKYIRHNLNKYLQNKN